MLHRAKMNRRMLLQSALAMGAMAAIPQSAAAATLKNFTLPAILGLTGYDGAPAKGFSSSDIEKENAVIVFFASWCPACREEHGVIAHLAQMRVAPVYGVAVDDNANDIRRFLGKYGNPFTAVGDDRTVDLAQAMGVKSLPYTLITTPGPRVLFRYDEGMDDDDLKKKILPLLTSESI